MPYVNPDPKTGCIFIIIGLNWFESVPKIDQTVGDFAVIVHTVASNPGIFCSAQPHAASSVVHR